MRDRSSQAYAETTGFRSVVKIGKVREISVTEFESLVIGRLRGNSRFRIVAKTGRVREFQGSSRYKSTISLLIESPEIHERLKDHADLGDRAKDRNITQIWVIGRV